MLKVVAALGRLKARQRCANRGPQELAGATAGLPQNRFQLRKGVLDRIQIRTVFREIPKTRAGTRDGPADHGTLVTRQVVHDDDVAGRQRRDQDLLDVGEEAGPIDRAIKHGRRGEARHAQGGEKRRGLPAAVGRVVGHAGAVEAAAVPAYEVSPHATFIEKHEARGIERRRGGLPGGAGERDVSAIVLGRAYRFF